MKKLLIIALLILCIPIVVLSKQPTLKSSKIEPAVAAPGDTVKITVEFTGSAKKLKEVSFIVREYPYDYPRTYFQPVKESKKNVWVLVGPVPYDAYEASGETLHLDLKAIDKDGKEIVTKGHEEQTTGKTGTIEFKVK